VEVVRVQEFGFGEASRSCKLRASSLRRGIGDYQIVLSKESHIKSPLPFTLQPNETTTTTTTIQPIIVYRSKASQHQRHSECMPFQQFSHQQYKIKQPLLMPVVPTFLSNHHLKLVESTNYY
jgi:hypothetical protein